MSHYLGHRAGILQLWVCDLPLPTTYVATEWQCVHMYVLPIVEVQCLPVDIIPLHHLTMSIQFFFL